MSKLTWIVIYHYVLATACQNKYKKYEIMHFYYSFNLRLGTKKGGRLSALPLNDPLYSRSYKHFLTVLSLLHFRSILSLISLSFMFDKIHSSARQPFVTSQRAQKPLLVLPPMLTSPRVGCWPHPLRLSCLTLSLKGPSTLYF